jgi:hypothetical protein
MFAVIVPEKGHVSRLDLKAGFFPRLRAERLLAGPPRRPRGHPNPVCFLLGLDGRPEDRFRQQRRLGRDLKVKLESPVCLQ